jgi:predicted nucleotidyltransferase
MMKNKKYPDKQTSGGKVSEPMVSGYEIADDLRIPEILKPYMVEVDDLCKNHHVAHLYVFGSVLRDDFNSHSDIDFLVDFDENDPIAYSDLYFAFSDNLKKILGRKIDLIELRAIKNPYFQKEVDENKTLIYGQ